VAATERAQPHRHPHPQPQPQPESSTLANPGRTSLHSQPETHIIQVVPRVGKGSKAGDRGLRWVNADGDVSIGRRIRIREAGQSFPRSLNARGMGMRSWNRIWTKGSGFGAAGDGYHSASWPGHQLIYGYAQGTN